MKLFFVFLIFTTSLFAQTEEKSSCSEKNKVKVSEFLEKVKEQNKSIVECEEQIKQSQIKEFGKVLPKIAGGCEWSNNGCPVSLVKPAFPKIARKLKVYGSVDVEIIADKNGSVIYAKAISGKQIFYSAAERAACRSSFNPKIFCGKSVFQKRIIRYNFIFQ